MRGRAARERLRLVLASRADAGSMRDGRAGACGWGLGSGVELVGKPGCVLKSFGLQVRFGGGGDNTSGMGWGRVECDCVRSWVLSLPR